MIRRAREEDYEKIKEFCVKNNKRIPNEMGWGIISEERGEINGFVHVAPKYFLDPLVVDESLHPVARIRIIQEILNTCNGACMVNGIDRIYFTAEGKFVEFLEGKFGVEKFTTEDVYIRKV